MLGGFETAAMLTAEAQAFNVVFVLRLAGGIPPERLERALAALQRRHRLLSARVVRAGRGHRFVDGAPPPPLRTAQRGSDTAWRAITEEELNRSVDLALGPPLRCVYLPPDAPGGSSEIVLTAHHAVLDGASSAPLLTELLALCDPSAALPAPDTRLPPAAEDLFPPRYRGWRGRVSRPAFLLRQLADEVVYRLRRRGPRHRPAAAPASCRILPLTLPEEATAMLVRRARRERVTLNGALTAALLQAVQRHLYGGEPGALRYFAFADLRPYLVPPPPPTAVAACVSGLRFTVAMGVGGDFWPLARRISRQIAAAGRRGDKFHAAALMPATMRLALRQRRERMATVALSYTGAVRLAAGSGPLAVRALHAFVSNLWCGPEFTASVKLVEERLAWDIVYLDADMSAPLAQRIGDEIMGTLAREGEPR